MDIGVNLLWLTPGVVGGSEEYTIKLLRAVDDVNQKRSSIGRLSIRLYANPQLVQEYPDLSERFDIVTAPLIDSPVAQKHKRILAEHSWLASQSRQDAVMHHAGGTIPLLRAATSVLTIHDLQPLEHPENFSIVKKRWLSSMIPRSANAARAIICPSRFTAERVVELLGVSEGKVHVVSQGHEPVAMPGVDTAAAASQIDEKYGRFLLYPAITYPHKRHRDLVEMLDRLSTSESMSDISLVFTGRRGPEHSKLGAQILSLGLSKRVHFLGRIPAGELDSLYRAATATVIPSSYEGFGNPALEAMARGCPVIVADAAALPEVVGNAGVKVPVGDIDAWVAAVEKVVVDSDAAAKLAQAGLVRAKSFDWETAGVALLEIYESAQHQFLRV